MNQTNHVRQSIERLQENWETSHKILSRLEKAKIIETDVARKFQLEQQINEIKLELQELERDHLPENRSNAQSGKPATTESHVRQQVFISYNRKDKKWLEKLQVYLKPLERQGIIQYWDDTRIQPGQKWRDEIKNALNSAKIAIFLVSSDFFASDFITRKEIPPLLQAADEEGALILSVILNPCETAFSLSELEPYQTVNPPSDPLSSMNKHDQDRVFDRVAQEIIEALKPAA